MGAPKNAQLERVFDDLGLSIVAGCEILSISVRTFSDWKNGNKPPSPAACKRLHELYGVNPNFLLLGGAHPMYLGEERLGEVEALIPVVRSLGDLSPQGYVLRPAGIAEDSLYGWMVPDDAMKERFKEGDIVFFSPVDAEVLRSGEDLLVELEWGELFLRRYFRVDKSNCKFKAINPCWQTTEVSLDQIVKSAQVIDCRWAENVRMVREPSQFFGGFAQPRKLEENVEFIRSRMGSKRMLEEVANLLSKATPVELDEVRSIIKKGDKTLWPEVGNLFLSCKGQDLDLMSCFGYPQLDKITQETVTSVLVHSVLVKCLVVHGEITVPTLRALLAVVSSEEIARVMT